VKLVVLEKAEIVEVSDREVRAVSRRVPVPSVVRLTSFVRFRAREAKFSAATSTRADDFRCQYCGHRLSVSELTCDHVVPRSRGGRTDWSNIVTCCVTCNRRKGGRTPSEAGLRLIARPHSLRGCGACRTVSPTASAQAWHVYLYLDRDLENVG